MNYFELHLGDYEAATAHLTALEDGIYGRLLRLYYRTEKPLPADKKQVYRLARAQTKPERDAVDQVLSDFFELRDDGWHQERCDAEIDRYQAGEPEREVKRANEDNRLRRHREERARLFKVITDAGLHAAWNIQMKELREMAERCRFTEPETPTETPTETAPATPATATQTPDTNHQTPIEEPIHTHRAHPTAAGRVCVALKAMGLGGVNPGHPDLLALIAAGASDEEFAGAATTALGRGKGFAYALGTLKRQRAEAAEMAQGLHRGPMPTTQRTPTAAEQRVLQACPEVAAPHLRRPAAPPPFTVDAEAHDAAALRLG